jgi:SlyX protein
VNAARALNNTDQTIMTQLEEHIAHLQRMVDDLSDVVTAQANQIGQLEHRVAMLMKREAEREADGMGGTFHADERPPHY